MDRGLQNNPTPVCAIYTAPTPTAFLNLILLGRTVNNMSDTRVGVFAEGGLGRFDILPGDIQMHIWDIATKSLEHDAVTVLHNAATLLQSTVRRLLAALNLNVVVLDPHFSLGVDGPRPQIALYMRCRRVQRALRNYSRSGP